MRLPQHNFLSPNHCTSSENETRTHTTQETHIRFSDGNQECNKSGKHGVSNELFLMNRLNTCKK